MRIRANLLPKEFVDRALERGKIPFLSSLSDTHVLLVRCGDINSDLVVDPFEEESRRSVKKSRGFAFRTLAGAETEGGSVMGPRARVGQEHFRLVAQLSEAPHFAVPLKKHERSGAAYPDRVTVGRAANQDVILNEASVSKAQAWFEVSKKGHLYLRDAQSRNGTYVNDRRLSPRERVRVEPGDAIAFAHVEAILCTPEALWNALQAE